MRRTIFARFENTASAEAAVAALRDDRELRVLRIRSYEHGQDGRLAEDLQHSEGFVETDVRHGIFVGIATGIVVGGLLGSVLFPAFFETSTRVVLTGGGVGALLGTLVGIVMSGLRGVGLTDRRLSKLSESLRDGEVILTIESADPDAIRRIERVLDAHGGHHAAKAAM